MSENSPDRTMPRAASTPDQTADHAPAYDPNARAADESAADLNRTGGVFSLALSTDGRTLASGSIDGTVKLWDPTGLRDVLTLPVGKAEVKCVAFSPDGKTLAGIATDGKVRVWR